MKRTLLLTILPGLLIGVFSLTGLAQKERAIEVGEKGDFHLGSSVRFGDRLLRSGMYRLEISSAGDDRFVVVRQVAMNRFGRAMGSTKLGNEVARIKCALELVNAKSTKTNILVRRNAADEREAVELLFRGDLVKCTLPSG